MRFLSILACAWSFVEWIKRRIFSPSTMNEQDYHRLDNVAGLYGPEVALAFEEYAAQPGYHKLKNIMVEWNKADSQRGMKLMSLVLIVMTLISLLIGFSLGLLV